MSLSTGASAIGALVGQVLADTQNANIGSLDGSGFLAYNSVTDWFHFDVFTHSWGKGANTAISHSGNRGACATGINCGIWDYSIKNADATGVRNFNGALVDGAACPSSVNGDVSLTNGNSSAADTYLVNATEIMFDALGDEDGLCEANEACIYSPNIGAYQGEGSLGTCTYSAGSSAITGVTMYGYLTNGH